jgi:putative ATP-binding cassette transporter
MKQVEFTYDGGDPTTAAFSLGPLDFHVRPGELVFVVGGNGSGKSTFLKVLTGLYPPHQGEIWLGGPRVSDRTREWYREHFSVVFADCFVFDTLLGLSAAGTDVAASHYLQLLQLDHRVRLRGDEFSTTALSQGQRKRLALLTAYLEDRPFYVFDEWAADQDPQYKDVFYSKLLPDLRQRGKAVVVITHDDRYFHLSDRIVKLEEGRVESAS